VIPAPAGGGLDNRHGNDTGPPTSGVGAVANREIAEEVRDCRRDDGVGEVVGVEDDCDPAVGDLLARDLEQRSDAVINTAVADEELARAFATEAGEGTTSCSTSSGDVRPKFS
jgi:hypothetical protein